MSKVLVSSNILTNVAQAPYMAHCNMWFRMGRECDDEFIFHAPNRNAIDVSRNQAAKLALQSECDYLLMYDDDSVPHPRTYESLKKADKDIIMALSYIRGYPYEPMFFKYGKAADGSKVMLYYRDFAQEIDENGLVECDAVGFHFVMIKCSVLKRMSYPYFVTFPGASTEDVYFCLKAKEELKGNVGIFVDTKVPAGHQLPAEIVNYNNVAELRDRREGPIPDQIDYSVQDHSKEEIDKWRKSV